jgi:hypothetical protein
MVIRLPPCGISGSASLAMRMKEWQEISIACAKAVGRTVRHAAMQVVFRRIGDGMDDEIEFPTAARSARNGFQLARHGHVERRHDGRLHLLRQRLHVRPGLVIEPGDGQLGTGRAQALAQPQAMLCALAMPTTSPRLPCNGSDGGKGASWFGGRKAGHGVAAFTHCTAPAQTAAAQVARSRCRRAHAAARWEYGDGGCCTRQAGICIFMNLTPSLKIRGLTSACSGTGTGRKLLYSI